MSARILLVEDDPGVTLVVSDLLKSEGYAVETAADGQQGLERTGVGKFDLLILDVMLPDIDGMELCGRARTSGYSGAVLMLTARGELADRVQGLRGGADDYLVKPFEPEELLARVMALLRRMKKIDLTPVMRFEFGDIVADFASGEVKRQGQKLSMTAKEVILLRYLVDHRGQVLSRNRLLEQLWSDQPYITPRTVDVYVSWLRQKLEDNPQVPRWIVTRRGQGYLFDAT